MGIPQTSRDSFELLDKNNIITEFVMVKMKAMAGFCNIAVHDYQTINLDLVRMIMEKHLDDFQE
ncbi:uncharacterized protein YutE (UPF0331/DUF86 family) [Anoxybacillus caldiproteolyticus]|uniref:Uncharacterized protein YutE (UPF0331/DUF86 family) n=1 Tax=Thermaerobacillus caldiproteolyticus TaxID=247480 RepID=A0A7W0BYE9_9BACL|nr:uncharacterized protein YutE (UPF0331/DUF86 family) [Anoxybacillus caldiproteolyticus]